MGDEASRRAQVPLCAALGGCLGKVCRTGGVLHALQIPGIQVAQEQGSVIWGRLLALQDAQLHPTQ